MKLSKRDLVAALAGAVIGGSAIAPAVQPVVAARVGVVDQALGAECADGLRKVVVACTEWQDRSGGDDGAGITDIAVQLRGKGGHAAVYGDVRVPARDLPSGAQIK